MHQPLTMRLDSDTKRNLFEDYGLPPGTNEMLKIQDWKMRRNEGNQTPGIMSGWCRRNGSVGSTS